MKKTRKQLCFVLSLLMVLCLLPATAQASEPPRGDGWSIDLDGTLTIINNAGMSGWTETGDYHSIVTSVVLENEVTAISPSAFTYCENLGTVSMGNSVEAIGASAFEHCTSLTSVTIPANVTAIGVDAFSSCDDLEKLVFLGSVPPAMSMDEGIFDSANLGLKILVPADSLIDYMNTALGKDYSHNMYPQTVVITRNRTTEYFPTLTDALEETQDGDTVTLIHDVSESAIYTISADTTLTIDGMGHKVTGADGGESYALKVGGDGTLWLKDITLQGGTATSMSAGLFVVGGGMESLDVYSTGTVTVLGGLSNSASAGVVNTGNGSVSVTTAGSDGGHLNVGAANYLNGTLNVATATASGGITCYGVLNSKAGTLNVGQATASGDSDSEIYGVYNLSSGAINVTDADGTKYGVLNESTGVVNVKTATGQVSGVQNNGAGTVNTGTSVAAITLNKGTGATCVLDSITVASRGTTTIGALPGVFKNGSYSNNWYTDSAKTVLFSGNSVTGAATFYSDFYTAPTPPSSGGGGGGGTPAVPSPKPETTVSSNTSVTTLKTAATTDANGSAAASVTGAQVTDAIEQAVKGATAQGAGTEVLVEIKVEGAGSANSVSTTIPRSSFTELSGSGADGLRISTPLASVTFDAAALDAIKGKAAGDIIITAALANTSGLTGAEKEAVGDRPVYDLTVASGSTTISDFDGGSATVSIPYKPSAGEDAGKIVIYYLSDSGELVMVPNCSYDAETGRVTFIARHFSNYVIGYNNVSFSDVSGWYKDYVNYLAARGILNGAGNGTFNPNSNITRAQFVTILANLSSSDLSGYTTSAFRDVSTTAWYSAAVQWAYGEGIVTGTGGKFEPNASITRQDMAVMIARYAEKAADYTLPAANKAVEFTDNNNIASYASDAVTAIQQAGIISGNSDGSFAPAANASRAQAAKMIALLQQGMME